MGGAWDVYNYWPDTTARMIRFRFRNVTAAESMAVRRLTVKYKGLRGRVVE